MTIEDFAVQLRTALQKRQKTALQIAQEIEDMTYDDGSPLSASDKRVILSTIKFGRAVNGKYPVMAGDNSAWLKMVEMIRSQVESTGNKGWS